jgi:hypothetical protein
MMPSPEPTQPPTDRPDSHIDDAGPYAQRPFEAHGGGEGASVLFAAIAVALHALLLGAAIIATMVVGARCEKLYREFNMKLDDFTAFALGVSRWLYNYWYVLVIVLVPGFFADGALLYLLHRSRPNRRWGYILAAVVVLLILAFASCMNTALYVPYTKLLNSLSQ